MIWRRLFLDSAPQWRLVAVIGAPTAVIALLLAAAVKRAAASMMRRLLQGTLATTSPLVRAPLRLIGFATFVMVFAVLIAPAFEIAELHPRTGVHLSTLSHWTFRSGLKVLLIGAFAFALIRTISIAVARFEHDVDFGTGLDAMERAKRARTLGTVLTNITSVVVLLIATLMMLNEVGVNISPALTGAGIVGVALGFGAQTLVRDLIGGFFLILENQIRVGDVAAINGVGGLVEAINLRTTVLRDEEGVVHVFPNGAINTLANKSLNFSYYVVNLPVAYGENVDAVTALLKDTAAGLQQDARFTPVILEPLEIIGVDAFEEHAVRLKARIKTAPQKQWFVGRELRRRILQELENQGIEMWSAQRTINIPTQPDQSSSDPSTPGRS